MADARTARDTVGAIMTETEKAVGDIGKDGITMTDDRVRPTGIGEETMTDDNKRGEGRETGRQRMQEMRNADG